MDLGRSELENDKTLDAAGWVDTAANQANH